MTGSPTLPEPVPWRLKSLRGILYPLSYHYFLFALTLPFLIVLLYAVPTAAVVWVACDLQVSHWKHLNLLPSSNEQLTHHGHRNPLLHPLSFFPRSPCKRYNKWHRRLRYLPLPRPLLPSMSRLPLHPLPQLHHIWRHVHVHGYVYGHVNDGNNKRGVLRIQHPLAPNNGILHPTKLQRWWISRWKASEMLQYPGSRRCCNTDFPG